MDLKAKGTGTPNALARAIVACVLSGEKDIAIKAVGAGAVNNAVKAAAIARRKLKAHGKDILLAPEFDSFQRGEEDWNLIAMPVTVIDLPKSAEGAR